VSNVVTHMPYCVHYFNISPDYVSPGGTWTTLISVFIYDPVQFCVALLKSYMHRTSVSSFLLDVIN